MKSSLRIWLSSLVRGYNPLQHVSNRTYVLRAVWWSDLTSLFHFPGA